MARVIVSVPEIEYQRLFDEAVAETILTATPSHAPSAAPAAAPGIDWSFVARAFVVTTLLLLAVRQLRRRRHHKTL